MNSPETSDPLSATLRTWRLRPSRQPQFRAEVWARIGAVRGPLSWAQYARAHLRVVAAALALAIVGGALAGRHEARTRVAESSAQLAKVYVSGLDARAMRMP